VSAAAIARALGGHRAGAGWAARCPAHEDRSPSLSIADARDGRLLLYCHAGCVFAQVLGALRARGLVDGRENDPERQRRVDRARALWRASRPAAGTPVEQYLRARGYRDAIPATLRFHPSALHADTGLALPAMIAAVAVSPSRDVVAIHRTFLTMSGSGKAPVSSPKKMLGPVAGGAVRLAAAEPKLGVVEGIETGLSFMQDGGLPVWCALSAGGLESLVLPAMPLARLVVIGADNDLSGRGQAAADRAAARWAAEGRHVKIVVPPAPGADWNDFGRAAA
jgi:putative DNA primase/helicase